MPVDHEFDHERRLIVLRYRDPLTIEDWRAALARVLASSAHLRDFDFLVDRRAAAPPTPEFARDVADFVAANRHQFGNARIAIVVADPAGYGMARMQEILNDRAELESRAFTDLDDALAWLGRSPGSP